MATFNGKKYLEAQIESILKQEFVQIELDILDDGSTDGTIEILNALLGQGKIHTLNFSNGLGASAAFSKLLSNAQPADFYAFSDQDDIWNIRKIHTQIQLMKNDLPILVISDRELIDHKEILLPQGKKREVLIGFNNALVQNVAFGNTQVLNPPLRDLVLSSRAESKYLDSWVYLIACAYGEVKRIDTSLVSYRIHESNAVGLGKKSFKHFRSLMVDSRDQCLLFSQVFTSKSQEIEHQVQDYLRVFYSRWLFQRIYFSLRSRIYRQSKVETVIWKTFAPFIGNVKNF
jgi:glycosyltransferase involved in cell wall biosynthesis